MRKRIEHKLWFMALLPVIFVAGCGREQGTLPPTLTAISPAKGIQGTTVAVTLTGTNFETGAVVNVSGTLDTPSAVTVVSATSITATFTIAANAAVGGRMVTVTTSGVTTDAVTFTVDPALMVTSTIPANKATGVPVDQALSATFSQQLTCSSVTTSTFTVSGPAGAVTGTTGCAGASPTFTPAANLASNSIYTATLTTGITDTDGDPLANSYIWTFTTAAAPTVTSTVPAAGATGVPVNQVLTANFSEAMNAATLSATTFTLTGPGGAVVGTVKSPTTTSATFSPAADLASNAVYTATITTGAQNTYGAGLATKYAWTFITSLPPTVTSTVPAAGATSVPVNQVLTANFSEAMNAATLSATTFTLTGPGGAVAGTVKSPTTTSATFSPAADLASNAVYTATITTGAQNTYGAGLAANYVWTFTTSLPPVVISTVPVSNATGVPINLGVITANFSEAMNAATLTTTSFTLTGPGGAVSGTVTSPSSTSATFSTTTNLTANTIYTATITTQAQNTFGAPLASNYVWTFRTAPNPDIPPTVISTNPANQATGVPINQIVTATFSEAMDPTTIDSATFTLTGPGNVAVAGTVSYSASGAIASFAPTAMLAGLTAYTATITTGAKDIAETPLGSNYVWTFTTAAIVNTTKPTIVSTIPASAAVAVPINQAISATFSQAMNPATINSTTFILTAPGGVSVPGLVTYASIAESATFTPLANLLPDTVYTATVTTGAMDAAGNALGAGLVPNPWSFTTAPTVTVVHPTIVSTNPPNAYSQQPINGTVNATFSEAMDPLTITTATYTLTGPGGTPIAGTVSYDPANFVAVFTPTSSLVADTLYTAEVTSGATDLAGNSLEAGAVPNPWTFTTAAVVLPPPPPLGTAALFGGFGGPAGMTNQGTLTVINGNIGTTGASTLMTGFQDTSGNIYTETPLNIGNVNGTIDTCPPPPGGTGTEGNAVTCAAADQAAADALTAYNFLVAVPAGSDPGAGQLGGLTLAPGTYTSAAGTFLLTGSDLTLDAQGDANAIWIFQMAASLTVGAAGAPRNVILANGAQAGNVFWQVGSSATINGAGGGTFVGTVIASAAISVSTAGNAAITTIDGRLLALNASTTLVNTVINTP